jgi:hypothetical protein
MGGDQSDDLGVDGRIILTWTWEHVDWTHVPQDRY